MMGYVYAGLQILIGLGVLLPLYLVSELLKEINPRSLSMRISRGPYYWAVVRKRRARGEPEWHERDLMIGMHDPSLTGPTLTAAELGAIPSVPKCVTCDNPVYGPVIAERCLDCWAALVNEKLEIE